MPNHVHLVVVPSCEDGLAKAMKVAHQTFTQRVNRREGWVGHLWQGRYHSEIMDEDHLAAAVRYIELNPVRAGLCSKPEDWPWSSVHAHNAQRDDDLVVTEPMKRRIPNWQDYLRT